MSLFFNATCRYYIFCRCPNYHQGKMAKKVYVVFISLRPGIYYDWKECHAQVDGYSRAHFRGYSSVVEASIDWSAFCRRSSSPNVPGDEIPDGRDSPVLKGSEHYNENCTSHQLRRSSRPTFSSPTTGVTNAHKDCDEENGNDDAAIIVKFIFGIFILVLFIQLMSLR
ncbi:uncharacterized protein LOC131236924 [Magnolia sinica]|uniref:uncharacterized protein LOC131236924 n=1 Tax=Magnolia sinica TaxID=86752 RepID=UPI002657E652|nr:uncharacterized protein LOC131236924 [Magnolia sinica]